MFGAKEPYLFYIRDRYSFSEFLGSLIYILINEDDDDDLMSWIHRCCYCTTSKGEALDNDPLWKRVTLEDFRELPLNTNALERKVVSISVRQHSKHQLKRIRIAGRRGR